MHHAARSALLACLLLAAPAVAAAEGGDPAPKPPAEGTPPSGGSLPGGPPPDSPAGPPADREGMWPAPTEEDWKRPCLITWQRTWDDALAVSKETGKPILVCVNMDGEIASEHYAGVRYRQPGTAALYEPYVTVIASVYRHNPKDYDDAGNRIPCPRFGGVTCGEHIWIEPVLYEKFFDGKRIAPRHVCIETDGRETYDVFYANDTASIFRTIRDGIAGRPATPAPVVRGDRPVVERVASRDVADRVAVEAAYRDGDAATRRALLEAALKSPGTAPVDLLRLAVFGLDPDLGKAARQALAKSESPASVGLIADALRVPMDPAEKDALVETLGRLGQGSPRARWLSVVHRGIGGKSTAVDVKSWTRAGGEYPAAGPSGAAPPAPAAPAGSPEAARAAEAAAQADLAESCLARALEMQEGGDGNAKTTRTFSRLLFDDARRAALRAAELGGGGWRTDTVLALAAYYLGDAAGAYAKAEAAVKALPPGDASWNSMAVLTVFAEGRWKAIKEAVNAKREWPPQWLTDLHSVYSILRVHPRATDARIAWHHDLLAWLGVADQASKVLEEGLERFPDSAALHERLRRSLLEAKGGEGLEAAYAELLRTRGDSASLREFAGTARVAAAEFFRGRRDPARAFAAYDRAIGDFDRAIAADPRRRDDLDRAAALVHAGRARLAFQTGEDGKAVDAILESFRRGPSAAGDKDALGFTPGETGKILAARLKARGREDLAKRVEAALATLDPELLRPDRE